MNVTASRNFNNITTNLSTLSGNLFTLNEELGCFLFLLAIFIFIGILPVNIATPILNHLNYKKIKQNMNRRNEDLELNTL